MKDAVLDIGTNSVRLLVAEQVDGTLKTICKDLRMTRLGDGLTPGGVLSEAACTRTLQGFAELVESARKAGAERFVGIGTNALREAKDGAEFAAKLEAEHGFPIRIIDGVEEARYSYLGAAVGGSQLTAVVDIGGGSTEIGVGFGGDLGVAVTMPLGAVRGTREFDMMTARGLAQLKKHAFAVFAREAAEVTSVSRWIGVGGTITTLAAIMQELPNYDPERIQGYKLIHGEVSTWTQRLAGMSYDERLSLPGLAPERADIIVAGAVIVESLMEFFALPELTVSDADMLEGIWREEFGK